MSKGLEALKEFRSQQTGVNVFADELLDIIETELNILENYRHQDFEMEIKLKKQDEILRIIKEHIAFRGGYIYFKGIPQSGELYNKLKGWLKNE